MDRHLSPTETARRFGVSIKALRLYEQRGLLKPARTTNGATGSAWRVYGPDQVARLHQILALKRLGLSLAQIGQVLAGPDALGSVLALQEEALAKDAARLARALDLVRNARTKLESGQALSIDDLANLTKETVMTRVDAREMGQALKPFANKHLSEAERAAFKAKIPFDRDQVIQVIDNLTAEAQALMDAGDPTSPAAQDLARRWSAWSDQLIGDNADVRANLRAKERAIWNDAMGDPAVAEKLAVNQEIFRFVRQAIEHMREQAK